MIDATSFLITERSSVNLHICKQEQLGHKKNIKTKGKPKSYTTLLFQKCKKHNEYLATAAASHHKVSAAAEHLGRNTAVRAAGVFRIQHVTVGGGGEEKRGEFTSETMEMKTRSAHWIDLTSSPPSSPEPAAPPAGCTAVPRSSLCQRPAAPSGWRRASLSLDTHKQTHKYDILFHDFTNFHIISALLPLVCLT